MLTLPHRQDLIGLFAQHKVAANLLMLIMVLSGVWAISRLNTQFLPNFDLDYITVRVAWSGASAEDVESSITSPIEQELRNLDNLKKLSSTSANGVASITLEYYPGGDMVTALDQVKERVALLRNLPATAEKPEISKVVRYELIARVLLTGPDDPNELRHLAHRMEGELLDRGIAKVTIVGLPDEEMAVQIPAARLEELGLSLSQVADKIAATSRDLPAGSVGRDDVARQLRSLEQRREAQGFLDIPLVATQSGQLLTLGDVAEVERRPKEGSTLLGYQGKRGVELDLFRAEHSDALKSAEIYQDWLAGFRPQLPPHVQLTVYDETWTLIYDRIMLLVKNGASSLLVVWCLLWLFLNTRVAWWVLMGIPISLLAALAILYLVGGSINMISLFAMIMTVGIIVDDAVVVGEDAFTHYQVGERSLLAAEGGARRMAAPVMASSLTTISAFLPLMLVGGIMGQILSEIPLVAICALAASVVECFFVLPGHLRKSFHKMHHQPAPPLRRKLEGGFERFKNGPFRKLVGLSVAYRWATLAATFSLLLLGVGLLASGRMNFTFFPSPDATMLTANVNFAAGTPSPRVDRFLAHLEETLWATDRELGGGVVLTAVARHGSSADTGGGMPAQQGEQFGSLTVELVSPDRREVRNQQFLRAWRERVESPPGLENFTIAERQGGPPGRDVEIRLTGAGAETLKAAALELEEALKVLPGVNAVEDDLPFGREQLIYRLRPEAQALGLSVDSVGRQLRAAFDGQLAQIFLDGQDEVEVRVMLPDAERHRLSGLEDFMVRLPDGGGVPLRNAVEFTPRRGFEALRHAQGRLAVQVSADVDKDITNVNKVLERLEETLLADLSSRYGIQYSYEGRAADQRETLADMKRGLVFALLLMYLILAWVFGSYGWPLIVMVAIPFGLIGALAGHWVMGMDLTILSLFGFFGLSGIVVNDSIVLVTFYKGLRAQGMAIQEALVEAACQRLRAVLLTSLTTIGGLFPLLLETSLQAQFLIPMAVSISFGLMFSTVLVLLVIPALLGIYETLYARWFGTADEAVYAAEEE